MCDCRRRNRIGPPGNRVARFRIRRLLPRHSYGYESPNYPRQVVPPPNSMVQITGSIAWSRSPSGTLPPARDPRKQFSRPDSPGQIHVSRAELVVLLVEDLVGIVERLLPLERDRRPPAHPLATAIRSSRRPPRCAPPCGVSVDGVRNAATIPARLVRPHYDLPVQLTVKPPLSNGSEASPTSTSTSIPRFCRHMSAISCACSGRNGTSPAFQV